MTTNLCEHLNLKAHTKTHVLERTTYISLNASRSTAVIKHLQSVSSDAFSNTKLHSRYIDANYPACTRASCVFAKACSGGRDRPVGGVLNSKAEKLEAQQQGAEKEAGKVN